MGGRRILVAAGLAAATILAVMTGPAEAGLSFCNHTEDRQMVAIGYSASGVWTSEGWWPVEAGACREILPGDLKDRFFYWRATTMDSVAKGGPHNFCVAPDGPFRITEATDCEDRGYVTAGFQLSDTGPDSRNFTIRIEGVGPGELATGTAPDITPETGPETGAGTGTGRAAGHGAETAGEPAADAAVPPGDPVAETAIFVGCAGRASNCRLDVGDWSIFVPDDGRTPGNVMAVLKGARPGDAVQVDGEAIQRFDISVVARLTGATILPPLPFDNAILKIRGGWHAEDNSGDFFHFSKDGVFGVVDGQVFDTAPFDVVRACGAHADAPPYLAITGDDAPRCYELRLPAAGRMELAEPGAAAPSFQLMRLDRAP